MQEKDEEYCMAGHLQRSRPSHPKIISGYNGLSTNFGWEGLTKLIVNVSVAAGRVNCVTNIFSCAHGNCNAALQCKRLKSPVAEKRLALKIVIPHYFRLIENLGVLANSGEICSTQDKSSDGFVTLKGGLGTKRNKDYNGKFTEVKMIYYVSRYIFTCID